jgi:hypothetical protein
MTNKKGKSNGRKTTTNNKSINNSRSSAFGEG